MVASVRRRLEPPLRHRTVDVAVVIGVLAVAILSLVFDIDERDVELEPEYIVLAAAGSLPLLWRRAHPIPVAIAVIVAHLGLTAASRTENSLILAAAAALYTVARTGQRRWAVGLAAFSAAASISIILSIDQDESLAEETISETAAVLLPVALGDAVRSRQDRVAAIIDAETSARVQEERLRIARDLHDIVAHGLSTIAVQSGVAAYNLGDRQPDDPARVALERINAAGKQSLEDLRAMVGVLRSTDDAPLRPTPTDPDDLSTLTEAAGLAGIELDVRRNGSFPDNVSDASVVAVHRIGQEALTNVARHAGPVPATFELHHQPDHVRIRIVNETSEATTGRSADPSVASTGVGITGMRERAESLGGSLTTSALPDGGFEVRATIPYRPQST